MLQIEQNDRDKNKRDLTGADIAALSFTTIVGIIIPPIAVLVLFMCVLEMILKAVNRSTPPIKNDSSIYRRFVRPIVRVILWGPVAATIVMLLLFLAVAVKIIGVPIILCLILFISFGGLRSLYQNKMSSAISSKTLTLPDQNLEKPGD